MGGAHKKTSYEFYTIMKRKLKYLNFKLAKKRHLKPGQMPKQIWWRKLNGLSQPFLLRGFPTQSMLAFYLKPQNWSKSKEPSLLFNNSHTLPTRLSIYYILHKLYIFILIKAWWDLKKPISVTFCYQKMSLTIHGGLFFTLLHLHFANAEWI